MVRYFSTSSSTQKSDETNEDTMEGDDDAVGIDKNHRHYDRKCERMPFATKFACAAKGLEALSRRAQGRLAVPRSVYLEPLGQRREDFFEQRLLSGLAWHCPEKPVFLENGELEWTFLWYSPVDALIPQVLRWHFNCGVSYEAECKATEKLIGSVPYLICPCCALAEDERCKACLYAIGFHTCEATTKVQWKAGTLHHGVMDFQRVLFNLHRRGIPTEALKTKADLFVANGDLPSKMAEDIILTIEAERGKQNILNAGTDDAAEGGRAHLSGRLTLTEMTQELEKRIEMMRSGAAGDGVTDQARVFDFIITRLEGGAHLRLMIQASAGTGDPFLFKFAYDFPAWVGWTLCTGAAPRRSRTTTRKKLSAHDGRRGENA